ncbi:MAG: TatD family hydrolase [Lachnospiraceae bacterium]|nr:TatD family hydrolase [Lachnospiraceae bacterium]
MIFETHAHYDDEKYDGDRFELLNEIHENGVDTIIDVGASVASSYDAYDIANKVDYVYAAVGVHPSELNDLNNEVLEGLKKLTENEKVVAIGEIGLDYYWEKDEDARDNQKYWFKRQLDLARELSLPVIIHSRDAAEDTMKLMKENKAEEIPGVIHCYSYSPEMAKEFVKMGYYIGVGGVVTFKNSKKLKDTVKEIPLESILLETDAPYLSPEPHRGERNRSDYIKFVAETIAEIKEVDVQKVYDVTTENAKKLFGI